MGCPGLLGLLIAILTDTKRISSRSLGNIGARAVVLKINIRKGETASKEEALRLCAIKMNFESSWQADSEGLIYLLSRNQYPLNKVVKSIKAVVV